MSPVGGGRCHAVVAAAVRPVIDLQPGAVQSPYLAPFPSCRYVLVVFSSIRCGGTLRKGDA